LWEAILCTKEPRTGWHAQDSIFWEMWLLWCQEFCTLPNWRRGDLIAIVSWKHFNMENIVTKKGEEKKTLKLIYKSTNSNELMQCLKPKLQYFVCHNFVARWQDQQFRNCLETFPNDIIILIIDFVENYNFEIQTKIQFVH
jgi:hypothetical protein